jgi:hypothetical protein
MWTLGQESIGVEQHWPTTGTHASSLDKGEFIFQLLAGATRAD